MRWIWFSGHWKQLIVCDSSYSIACEMTQFNKKTFQSSYAACPSCQWWWPSNKQRSSWVSSDLQVGLALLTPDAPEVMLWCLCYLFLFCSGGYHDSMVIVKQESRYAMANELSFTRVMYPSLTTTCRFNVESEY